jgi:serine-type D-Ala-D-Ala carboxypeptidase
VTSSKEKIILNKLNTIIPNATEGVVTRAYVKGKLVCDVRVGRTYDFYDWASLTKIVFLASNAMRLWDMGRLDLKGHVADVLPWVGKRNIIVEKLLNHSSGLPWWYPFHKNLTLQSSREEKWLEIAEILRKLKITSNRKSVYSDVGIFTFGFVLERLFEKPVLEIWNEWQELAGIEKTHYHVENKPVYARERYAPTESCPWRHKILRGEVHDDNTWALGGVAPHAGLFGPMDDLEKWSLRFRAALKGEKKWIISKEALKYFTKRSVPTTVGDWALGFMMPTKGSASCGKYFSPVSIGHTGFTGTSFWYDPKVDLLVLILSNRVHPTRENREFVLQRPNIHNWIYETYLR